jgi:dipeptidyl aminopeptidase/acylaminoacyl peptidase
MKKNSREYITSISMIFLFITLITVYAYSESIGNNISDLKGKIAFIKNGNVWIYDPHSKEMEPLTSTGEITNFNVSYDRNKIVLVKKNKKLYLLDLMTKKEDFLTEVETDMSSPALSPANDKIAYVSKSEKYFAITPYLNEKVRHIWLFEIAKRKKIDLTSSSSAQHSAVSWSPNGSWLSFSRDWKVCIMSTLHYNQIKELASGGYSTWLDGQTMAIGDNKKILIYDINSLERKREINFNAGFFPSKFILDGEGNLFYEDMTENPDLDISVIDSVNQKRKVLIEDGRSPVFIR